MSLIFRPFGIALSLLAGFIASWGAKQVWSLFDDEDAPEPDQREATFGRLIPALLLQGAIFKLVKGLVDNGSRRGFMRLTGQWPGEEDRSSA
jgi:Protein of unknown function (DUF4235)